MCMYCQKDVLDTNLGELIPIILSSTDIDSSGFIRSFNNGSIFSSLETDIFYCPICGNKIQYH